jgi:RepB DNA-primase from phage plasmid
MNGTGITNELFLEALFEDAAPGGYTVITSFVGDPYSAARSAWFGRPWMPGQRLRRGFDCGNTYLTVSSFTPDPQSGECRRRKSQFHSLLAVMVDDVGTKVDRNKLRLPATAVIETSPGNEQHYLFVRQDAVAHDRSVCERLIQAMIKGGLTSSGADPGMAGVTRYGRLPAGINGKAKYVEKLGRPFRTRCLSFEPTRRYAIAEIAAAWRLDLTQPEPRRRSATLTAAQVTAASEQFSALVHALGLLGLYRGRIGSGPWHEITCPWIEEHTDRADSGAAVSEPTLENGFRGGFRCHHAHGERLHMTHLRAFMRELVHGIDRQRASA